MSRKLTSVELKSIREAIGFTSKDMAKRLGVTLNTEIRMEAGIRTVSQRHSDQVWQLLKQFDENVKRLEKTNNGCIFVPWDILSRTKPPRYQRMVALQAALKTNARIHYNVWMAEK